MKIRVPYTVILGGAVHPGNEPFEATAEEVKAMKAEGIEVKAEEAEAEKPEAPAEEAPKTTRKRK